MNDKSNPAPAPAAEPRPAFRRPVFIANMNETDWIALLMEMRIIGP